MSAYSLGRGRAAPQRSSGVAVIVVAALLASSPVALSQASGPQWWTWPLRAAGENSPPAGENPPPAGENSPPAGENSPPAGENLPPARENLQSAGENAWLAGTNLAEEYRAYRAANPPVVVAVAGTCDPCTPQCYPSANQTAALRDLFGGVSELKLTHFSWFARKRDSVTDSRTLGLYASRTLSTRLFWDLMGGTSQEGAGSCGDRWHYMMGHWIVLTDEQKELAAKHLDPSFLDAPLPVRSVRDKPR
eukprot:1193078-Prorocentrum_minimum.AAC.2